MSAPIKARGILSAIAWVNSYHVKSQKCGHKTAGLRPVTPVTAIRPKTRHDSELLDSLKASLSDLQSVRLVSSNDPQLVALKKDIRQAILALESSPPPTVKMTVEMRQRATEMRKQADEMRKRAAEYRAYAEKRLRSSE
jgi:hypothetical protein